jgi:ATP/maltotriose-dependent transcriptional regulator MalT
LNALEGDYDGARDALDRGLAIARREGDVALQMQALAFSADVEVFHLHWHEGLEKALQAIELTSQADNPLAEMFANGMAVSALRAMGGDKETLEQYRAASLAAAERLHDRVWLPLALGVRSRQYSSQGDWQSARELSDRGLALAPRNPATLLSRILMEYEVGDFEQGEVYLERLMDVASAADLGSTVSMVIAWVIPEVARITGANDRFEIAEAAAEAILASPSLTPIDSGSARLGLAIIAVQRADAAAASEQYAALQVLQGFRVRGSNMSADRVLGLLAQTMGSLDQAVVHFEDALASCRKADFRPELAWSCCDYADMLLQRDDYGDRAKAITLLEESLAISSELGMPPLMARVTERLERAQVEPDRAPVYPDGLTQREVEVLRLIAGGKTNLEIAEELVIAEGTARRHVANIYEKIGAANRAEATRYALSQGLLSLDDNLSSSA